MRSYPTDSSQAMARIVALAALADGSLHPRELSALQGAQLPLSDATLHAVLREFCEDLLSTHDAAPTGTLTLDDAAIAALLDEVQDASLRARLLRLCVEVVEADGHLAGGECQVLRALASRWYAVLDGPAPPGAAAGAPA